MFEHRADPTRGAGQRYGVPSVFLREIFRRTESGLYLTTNDFEPAHKRLNGFDLLQSMKNRQSLVHVADPKEKYSVTGGSAYVAITDFRDGVTSYDRRHGTAVMINATAHFESQINEDRTLFAMKGFFSANGETFYLHKLQQPDFETRHHNGAKDMNLFRDNDVMTTFAFARAMLNDIFNDGYTSNTPYAIWQEQEDRKYHGQSPVWQTRLDTPSADLLKPRK